MQQQSPSQKKFLREATERYRAAMAGSPAEAYLASRSLGWASIKPEVDRFALGYVGDPLPGHEMFRGYLAVPYLRWSQDRAWSVASIRFRCIQEHVHEGHGKYMSSPGDRPRLFNTLALLPPRDTIAVTEGELDAITAQAAGVPAVGVPGAESWKKHFRLPFRGYKQVFILADGDEAGRKFAATVAASLPNSRIVPMPPRHDVNSFVAEAGSKALEEILR